jgi:CheY-like chemotaxis protein
MPSASKPFGVFVVAQLIMTIKHTILYAENDFDDFYLLKTAFEYVRPDIDLIHVGDGWELLEHLQNLKLPSLYPALILLDINMEGIGGKETLKLLKATKRYSGIPVAMFTSSRSETDRVFCKEYDINMITKPSSFDDLLEEAKRFGAMCDELKMVKNEQ